MPTRDDEALHFDPRDPIFQVSRWRRSRRHPEAPLCQRAGRITAISRPRLRRRYIGGARRREQTGRIKSEGWVQLIGDIP